MLAVPIPPKYPGTPGNGMSGVTSVETVNALHHPEGAEYRFQVGEGTYVLRDDLQLATPPPHPSDIPPVNPNPLATNVAPPTSGVKISLVSLHQKTTRPELARAATIGSSLLKWKTLGMKDSKDGKETKDFRDVKDSEKDVRFSTDSSSETSGAPGSTQDSNRSSTVPVFGEGNAALAPVPNKDPLKRRKPKNNIVKSNSSFVSRVITHEGLTKRLGERDPGGTFAFSNINRSVQWLDLSSSLKADPLTKILFTKAHMLCHDINAATRHATHLDIIMGSSASDMIWYEPLSQKYARINKNGIINPAPVSKIRWIPGSENLFLAAHMDGCLIVYDKEKEDASFFPEEPPDEAPSVEDDEHAQINITKSVNSSNQRANPVACWKLSNQKINDFAFSPDSKFLAVVGEDGYLRIIDHLREKITDIYPAYYGGFTCVCWSPDGKYILTGGQDDLVTIWSLTDRQIVARCHGHDSWVTAVAFDPWRCDHKTYRFGSIGADRKLLLWDFSVGMLHRPKGAMARARGSISAQSVSLARNRTESASVGNHVRTDSNRTQTTPMDMIEEYEFVSHELEPDSRVAQLPPVLSKIVDDHPLSALAFEQDCIITACDEGHVRTWDRPDKMGARPDMSKNSPI